MRIIDKFPVKKLKELYWQRKMSSPEIAKIYHITPEYTRALLRKYGIKIKTKSEAKRLFYNINISENHLKRLYLEKTISSVKIAKEDLIEPWILKNKKYFAAFSAGYGDAEGSFCIYNGKDGVFNIRSQDKNILHQIRAKLIELRIFCRPPRIARKKGTKDIRGTISNEDIWGLWVYRKDALLKTIDLLSPYLKHADKRKSMEIVKNNVLERNKKYNNQPDRRFYKLYLEEGIKI